MTPEQIVTAYFTAFNADDPAAMLDMVTDDIEHHVNEGAVRHGKPAFAEFLAMMQTAYREQAKDIVVLTGPDGRMAAEFTIHGTYLKTQEDCPPARGQTYVLPVGSFFTLRDGKIARVTTFYNLADWLDQVT
ncbi:nuclear transport factor 2 family protein [Oceaniglobus ichthyenteri]|uniref:nuclear transport factor 2 family protein n=1 Tax=Oceaniglobus ichthyenteri TaxID=2136177 RepID=UPI000D344ED1|nr:ketosteroid isomerase-related protein [Oceaniglobus ichthyenteri]